MIVSMKNTSASAEQLQMAEVLAANEINDVMADFEIIEESLQRTFLFKEFPLRQLAIRHLQRFQQNSEKTNFSRDVLQDIYKHYFPEKSE